MANKVLAILPITDELGDQDYLCAGVSELLIDAADRAGIECAARPRAAVHKGPAVDIKAAAAALHVNVIMTGTLASGADGKLTLRLKLTDMPEATTLWEQSYDFSVEGVLKLTALVFSDLLKAMEVQATPEMAKRFTYGMSSSAAALEAFFRGLQAVHGSDEPSNRHAIEHLSKAVELDSKFAHAYARLSEAHAKRYQFYTAHNNASLKAAVDSAQIAVLLAPELAEAQYAMGVALMLSKDFIKAGDMFETAHKLDPKHFGAWYEHAGCCFQQGLLKQAATLFEKASEVRPFDYQSPLLLRQVYLSLGRLDDATNTAKRGIKIAMDHIKLYPHEARAYYLACGAMMQLGMYKDAVDWAAKALEIDPEDPTINYNVACCYAQIGEYDKALDCLDKVKGFGLLSPGWLKNDSDLFSLHGHPRFKDLLQSLSEPAAP